MKKNKGTVKTLKLIAKIIISVGVFWYITTKIDLSEIGAAISKANLGILVVSLLIYMASQVASSFRLNILFRLIPVHLSEITNLKLYWLGLFYNLFLPGGVGGDGFKIYLMNHYLKVPVKKLLGAVFVDRLSGLTIIMTYLLVLLYFIDYAIPYKSWVLLILPLPLLGLYVLLRWFFPPFRKAFTRISLWSIMVQGIQMLATLSILYALGIEDIGRYDDYLFLFFLSSIMASVPITLGGIGAREFTFLMGAEYLNLRADIAIALSLLFFLVSVVSALPGFWYTLKPRRILMSVKD